VCIGVFGLGGSQVWHHHIRNLEPNDTDNYTWDRSTEQPGVKADKGIYTYRVLVMHGDVGTTQDPICGLMENTPYTDKDKSWPLEITNVSVTDLEWGSRPPIVEGVLHYTLSRDAAGCSVDGCKPDLSHLWISTLPSTAGSHDVPFWTLLDPAQMGPCSFVVRAEETEADGLNNRDQRSKRALQKGTVEVIWPPAYGAVGEGLSDTGAFGETAEEVMYVVNGHWNTVDGATHTRYVGSWGAGKEQFEKCAIIHTHTHAWPDHLTFNYDPAGPDEWWNLTADPPEHPATHDWCIRNIGGADGLDHCLFVMYAGCYTAKRTGGNPSDLIDATLDKGVDCAGGWGSSPLHLPDYLPIFWGGNDAGLRYGL